jgi:hypothetical protein
VTNQYTLYQGSQGKCQQLHKYVVQKNSWWHALHQVPWTDIVVRYIKIGEWFVAQYAAYWEFASPSFALPNITGFGQ